MRRRFLPIAGVLTAALTLTMCSAFNVRAQGSTKGKAVPQCPLPTFGPGNEYHPTIHPASFTARVDNPYFPLTPGTISVYTGVKDGKKALDIVDVTSRTKVVDGVTTRIVEDRLYLDNVLEERTSDYYAQDACGNVWYFGEDTAELNKRGKVVSTEGSFLAGVDGAQPGVFMEAKPELGRWFRQEWSPGNAEDAFKVIDLDTQVTVPAGRFRHALRTKEVTALEPDVVDNKVYVRGIGEVLEKSVKGPTEVLRLIEVIR